MDTHERFIQDLKITKTFSNIGQVTADTTIMMLPFTLPFYYENGNVVSKGLPKTFSSQFLYLDLYRFPEIDSRWVLDTDVFFNKNKYTPVNIPNKLKRSPFLSFNPADEFVLTDISSELASCSLEDFTVERLSIVCIMGIEVAYRWNTFIPTGTGIVPKLYVVPRQYFDMKVQSLITAAKAADSSMYQFGFISIGSPMIMTMLPAKVTLKQAGVRFNQLLGIDFFEASSASTDDAGITRQTREILAVAYKKLAEINIVEDLDILSFTETIEISKHLI